MGLALLLLLVELVVVPEVVVVVVAEDVDVAELLVDVVVDVGTPGVVVDEPSHRP